MIACVFFAEKGDARGPSGRAGVRTNPGKMRTDNKTAMATRYLLATPKPVACFLEDVDGFEPGVCADGVLMRLVRAGHDGLPAARWAVERAKAQTVRQLVALGGIPGELVVVLAGALGRADVVREVVGRVDVDARCVPSELPGETDARVRARLVMATSCREAAIGVASLRGHAAAVRELVRAGPAIRGAVLVVASGDGHAEIVSTLLQAGVRARGALLVAAMNGHVEVVRTLLRAGAGAVGVDAIAAAVNNGHLEVARVLMRSLGA